MKFVISFFAVLIGGSIALYTVLQNGSLLQFLDAHPHPRNVPAVEFFIAEGYYMWDDLQNSATYYQRVAERYPNSSFADDAAFGYLQSLDDLNVSRRLMADGYAAYLERFPHGNHTDIAQKRLEYCRNAR